MRLVIFFQIFGWINSANGICFTFWGTHCQPSLRYVSCGVKNFIRFKKAEPFHFIHVTIFCEKKITLRFHMYGEPALIATQNDAAPAIPAKVYKLVFPIKETSMSAYSTLIWKSLFSLSLESVKTSADQLRQRGP